MADATIGGAVADRLALYLPRLGFGLAVLSALMLALAPIGWRTGLWHFRTSFWYFMQPAACLGVAAGVVSLIALFWWGSMGTAGRGVALAGLAVGALMFYVPWSYYHMLGKVPRIHDITTDTGNPPTFSPVVLEARAAEKGNSTAYDPKTAALQRQGYPDLSPVSVRLPPPEAFERALAAARDMPGWTIVETDPASGRIEASERTRFMGFTDDVVIRVAPDGSGSRVDIRSVSRQGTSDFGVNARRIRVYEERLKRELG